MKTVLIILLSGLMGVTALTSHSPGLTSTDRYCNGRFNYCIQYDREILSEDVSNSETADGSKLISSDGSVEVNVYGAFNPLQLTPEELFAQNLQHFRQKSAVSIDDNTFVISKTGYSVNLQTAQYNIRQQLIRRLDTYMVLTVMVSKDRPELLARVMESTRFIEPTSL